MEKRPVRVPLIGRSLYLPGMTPLMDWVEAWASFRHRLAVGQAGGRAKRAQISPFIFEILF
jgi:hypothetical protein